MIREGREGVSLPVVATTLRKAKTATQNDWGRICYCDGNSTRQKIGRILRFLTASEEADPLPPA